MVHDSYSAAHSHHTPRPTTPTTTMNPIDAQLGHMKETTEGLSRQMMMQQLFVEERIRSDGDSGIKQRMVSHRGTRPFLNDIVSPDLAGFRESWTSARFLTIGPNIFVMNGVEFRLPGQSYRLQMPSTTSHDWHKTEDIPYPPVPPSVLAKHNVTEQIAEMQEYFRAFKNQDAKIRSDYSHYFKPVLCYLEGAWVDGASHNPNRWLGEAYYIEYTAEDGMEDNHSFNPTKIMNFENGTASYAHWQTRILCHPIKQELKLASFFVKDDLAARLSAKVSLYDFSKTNSARFQLTEFNRPSRKFYPDVGYGKQDPTFNHYNTLDSIMEEIPGKDNYPVHITGGAFGLTAYNPRFTRNHTEMNIGYYNHWYKVNKKGAMGTTVINRGFADKNLWVAKSTQHNLAPAMYTSCAYNRHTHTKTCNKQVVKYSYALPLEIVWMTPLQSWNPYNIQYFPGDIHKSPANSVTAHGHNGHTATRAYNGTNVYTYYRTPAEFFTRPSGQHYAMDRHGNAHRVVPSGFQTILRDIPTVGNIRLRYPVVPTHQEGNAIYKEIDALKELVMNMAANAKYFRVKPPAIHVTSGHNTITEENYQTSSTSVTPPGVHHHDIYLSADDIADLESGKTVAVYTSLNNGHQHALELYADKHIHYRQNHYKMSLCDGRPQCWDHHTNRLYYQR